MFKFIKNISTKNASRVDLVSIYGINHVTKTYDANYESTQKEIHILSLCKHPNIIKYSDSLNPDSEHIMLVFPVETRSLTDLICNYMFDKWDIIRQLMEGLCYLHYHGVLHLDFKSDNIMYTGGQIKIIDMGSSEIITPGEETVKVSLPKCTLTHRPPEGYYHGVPYMVGKHFDMWSLGIIVYEILTEKPMHLCEIFPPYNPSVPDTVFEEAIRSDSFRNTIRKVLPVELKDCVCLAPTDRPLLNHF